MKKVIIFFLSLVILFTTQSCVFAENNPISTDNNKFGIHIIDEHDLKDAATLVNSGGGDWGYITFVITQKERDHGRWQKVFDDARRLHLIPIVRIATEADGDNWAIPEDEEIETWINFLNSLNWVIQNRYVIIGNEPNHAKEWGGKIDPEAYAAYLNTFALKLHEVSDNFYVLPAGLDASAKNTSETMDGAIFIRRMLVAEPNLFDNLDGWVSHSYPNPDFAGKETDTGRGSIQTYAWELSYLQSLGITKDLPVFITETGWSNKKVNPDEISRKYKYAFENVWNDKRVVAVTPFILNYTDLLFSEFSWKRTDGSFYPYFDAYKNIEKVKGSPIQIESGQIIGALAQPIMFSDSDFAGAILAKNTGQSIWNTESVKVKADDENVSIKNTLLFDIEPLKTGLIVFKASSTQKRGILIKSIYLSNNREKRITNSFPVEGVIIKTDKEEVRNSFEKILEGIKENLNIPL